MKQSQLLMQRQIDHSRNFKKFKNFALDVFRWDNLPDGIESRDIENFLFEYGKCFFYKNKAMGLVCLPCYDSNQMNIYGHYDKGNVFSMNGLINEFVDYSTGVQIWNNDLYEPTYGYIKDYSDRMSEVELSIKMNVHQQKFPYFIACSKKNETSWRAMYKKIELGDPAIFHSDALDVDNMQVLETTAPYVVDKLNQYRYELEREILTFLGINNNFEKAERLVVDEVNSNNEFIIRNVEIQYKNRLKACEKINEMFNLNITVSKVSDLVEEEIQEKELEHQKAMQDQMQEGGSDQDDNKLE